MPTTPKKPKKKRLSTSAFIRKLTKANAHLNQIKKFQAALENPDCYLGLQLLIGLLGVGAYGLGSYDTALKSVSKMYGLSTDSMNNIALALFSNLGFMVFSGKNLAEFVPTGTAALANSLHAINTQQITPTELIRRGREIVERDQPLSTSAFAYSLPLVIASLFVTATLQNENGANPIMLAAIITAGFGTNSLCTAKLPQTFSEAISIFRRDRTLSRLDALTQTKLNESTQNNIREFLQIIGHMTKKEINAPAFDSKEVSPAELVEVLRLRQAIADECGQRLDDQGQPVLETTDGNWICLDEDGQPIKQNANGDTLPPPTPEETIEFARVLQAFDNSTQVLYKLITMLKMLDISKEEYDDLFKPESWSRHGWTIGLATLITAIEITSVAPYAFTMPILEKALSGFFSEHIGEAVGNPLGTGLGIVFASISASINFAVNAIAGLALTKMTLAFIRHPIDSLKSLVTDPFHFLSALVGGAVAYGTWTLQSFMTAENNPVHKEPATTLINDSAAASASANNGLAAAYLTNIFSRWLWSKCCNKNKKLPQAAQERIEANKVREQILEEVSAIKSGFGDASTTAILKQTLPKGITTERTALLAAPEDSLEPKTTSPASSHTGLTPAQSSPALNAYDDQDEEPIDGFQLNRPLSHDSLSAVIKNQRAALAATPASAYASATSQSPAHQP